MAQLQRELTAWDGVAIVIGITMGVGIFATPGRVAAYLPSMSVVLVAWVLAALTSFLGGMIYAELGSRLPHTGGEYIYLQRAFGPFVSFVYGWTQLLIIRTNPGAALSLVAAEYLEYFLPLSQNQRLTVAIAIVVALGAANYFGLRPGKRIQNTTTVMKVGGCLVLVAAAVFAISDPASNLTSSHNPPQSYGAAGNFASAMLLTIFTFIGYDRLGFLAGEMRRPAQDIPRVLFFGIGALTLIYLFMILAYHSLLPIGEVSGRRLIASDAAQLAMGTIGGGFISLIVVISAIGSTNGTIMSCSRIYYAMARDGLFLSFLARVHPRYRSPHVAVIAHCVWVVVLLLVGGNLETFIGSLVFVVLVMYAMMTVALVRIRRAGVGDPPAFRVRGSPWSLAAYLFIIGAMTVTTCYYHPRSALLNLLLVASAAPFYLIWKRDRNKDQHVSLADRDPSDPGK